jgi:hypothetical protein
VTGEAGGRYKGLPPRPAGRGKQRPYQARRAFDRASCSWGIGTTGFFAPLRMTVTLSLSLKRLMQIAQAAQAGRGPSENLYVGHRCVTWPGALLVRIPLT